MSNSINYWSISSQVLTDEAEKLGLEVDIVSLEKNLFFIRSTTKEVLFKSTDFGGNTALSHKIANDKELTYAVLDRYSMPLAKTFYLSRDDFSSFDVTKLDGFVFPLVLKPISESHGNGVCMNILSVEELNQKMTDSFELYDRLMVQEQIEGDECRVVVVLDEVIVAYKRIPPCIIGDGVMNIAMLIGQEDLSNPFRGNGYKLPLSHICMDDELVSYIAKQGYHLDSVLLEGIALPLRGNSNVGTGGTIQDITHLLHPETKSLCVNISKMLGFSICGIDLISRDFEHTPITNEGIILEINCNPGIGGERELTSINTGRRILEKLFFAEKEG